MAKSEKPAVKHSWLLVLGMALLLLAGIIWLYGGPMALSVPLGLLGVTCAYAFDRLNKQN